MNDKSTILIIDDESINISVVANVLKKDYDIKVATDGKNGIELLKRLVKVDLILLDIVMPGLDGYQVASLLKSDVNFRHIPIIFLTAKSDPESVIKGFRCGAIDYISKPFIKEELNIRVSNHIKIYKLQNELAYQVEKEIEKRKRNEHILIQQAKMAEMGEMIGNIAHQWRQPLNALGLVIQKIKIYHDEGMLTSENLDKSIQKGLGLINKMSTTIDDFRNFFKADKEKINFFIETAIQESINILEESFKSKGIAVNLNIEEDISLVGLKNELEQVIFNILNNAKDALIDNNIENKKIDIKVVQNSKEITIYICDNAGGVPIDIINKIFDPYFTTKEQGSGTGIGLYMSKMIVENNLQGTLNVINKDNGACFIIKLNKKENDI